MTNTQPSLRERQQLATKREIMTTALVLFEKQGFRNTTIDEISQAAGVSARTVFRHFETKSDLVLGWLPKVEEIVQHVFLPEMTPETAIPLAESTIEAIFVEYLQTAADDPAELFTRFRRLVQADPDLALAIETWKVRVTAIARDRLREQLGEDVSDLDIQLILQLLAAPVTAAAEAWTQSLDSDLVSLYRAAKTRRGDLLALDGPGDSG